MSAQVWWRSLADGSRRDGLATVLKCLLAPFALLYAMMVRFRAMLYRSGLLPTHRLPCPVISIGNVTVGGTGKTPATICIAQMLQQLGYRVAVLSRGYGGSLAGQIAIVSDGTTLLLGPQQAGDEPCLLAQRVPGLMVVIGADRYQAGLLALEQLKPDLLLLDDGFQHIRLHRDLNILLLDAANPLGNGWTLPLGLLREPPSAMERADLVIFTRSLSGQTLLNLRKPFSCSHHQLTGFRQLETGIELPLERLQQGQVVAFAGIADPAAFFASLQQMGIQLAATYALPDHEPYSDATGQTLERLAADAGADWLITTEKDGIKLAGAHQSWNSKLVTAQLELQLADGGQLLHTALQTLLADECCAGSGRE